MRVSSVVISCHDNEIITERGVSGGLTVQTILHTGVSVLYSSLFTIVSDVNVTHSCNSACSICCFCIGFMCHVVTLCHKYGICMTYANKL